MKKTIAIIMFAALIFSMIAAATLNSLIMKVGQQQATSLVSNVPGFESTIQAYNAMNDPQGLITGVAMQTAMAAVSKEAPELYKAYQIVSSPSSFISGTIKSEICDENKGLCNAYDTGMQVKSAAQDPASAAKMYALQQVSKDPKVGGKISQAFMIKGYVDELMAEPAASGTDAAIASKSNLPKTASTGPTGAAVANPDAPFSDVNQNLAGSCAIGFTFGDATPMIGDIQSCEITKESADIAFAFNKASKEGVFEAKTAGKGCTISKIGTKVYIYNADSCAIDIDEGLIEEWAVPASGKGTYVIFDKLEEYISMVEGRFVPKTNNQLFKFGERGYQVPLGGVLYYKNEEFEMDLSNAKTTEFSLFSYDESVQGTETKVKQLGKEKLKIIRTMEGGFQIEGQAEVTNQFNKIYSSGAIVVDSRGILISVGENSAAQFKPTNLNIKPNKETKNFNKPEDIFFIQTGSQQLHVNMACADTIEQAESGIQALNLCTPNDNELKVQKVTGDAAVVYAKAYTAKKSGTCQSMLGDVLKPGVTAQKPLYNRIIKRIEAENLALDCKKIEADDEIFIKLAYLKSKGTVKAELKRQVRSDEASDLLTFVSPGTVELVTLGTPRMTLDNDKSTITFGTPVIRKPALSEAISGIGLLGESLEMLEAPIEEIDTKDHKLVPNADGSASACRRGGEVGETVPITGKVPAEGESCSVTFGTAIIQPKPERKKPSLDKKITHYVFSGDSIEALAALGRMEPFFEEGKSVKSIIKKTGSKVGSKKLCEVEITFADGSTENYQSLGCSGRLTGYSNSQENRVLDKDLLTKSGQMEDFNYKYGVLEKLFRG